MTAGRSVAALMAAASLLSGCASMREYHQRIAAKKRAEKAGVVAAPLPSTAAAMADGQQVQITSLRALPPPSGAPVAVAEPAATPTPAGGRVPPGMQFLYGSGEAAALSLQAYLGLIDTIIARSSAAYLGHDEPSVVLAPGSTLAKPVFMPCGTKPLAVVFDIDETALLNLGYEADDSQRTKPYDSARWARWEKTGVHAVAATPGMIEAQRVAQASKVTFVFNSNRSAANAAETAAALAGAGLGPVEHGKTLWLQGDEGEGSGKDARRWAIAKRYCVIAMAGDQLGDFSDLFNGAGTAPRARRALVASPGIKMKWGHGWFVLPNPVYGTALKGGIDDVFPADKRWTDPGAAQSTGEK